MLGFISRYVNICKTKQNMFRNNILTTINSISYFKFLVLFLFGKLKLQYDINIFCTIHYVTHTVVK